MRSKHPLVSVIIPNYNYGNFLEICVQSVLDQTYSPIEIIVVDDGSTDNSLKVLNKYGGNIRVIKSGHFGAIVSRNLGALNSNGEFIAFLDADDYWLDKKIELQVENMLRNKTDGDYCNYFILNDDAIVSHETIDKVSTSFFYKNPTKTPFIPSGFILTKELAARVGSWNTFLNSPSEDFDYFRRCLKFGRLSKTPECLVVHREHAESLTKQKFSRYFKDNQKAVRIMLVEERSVLNVFRRFVIWNNFYRYQIKHLTKLFINRLANMIKKKLH